MDPCICFSICSLNKAYTRGVHLRGFKFIILQKTNKIKIKIMWIWNIISSSNDIWFRFSFDRVQLSKVMETICHKMSAISRTIPHAGLTRIIFITLPILLIFVPYFFFKFYLSHGLSLALSFLLYRQLLRYFRTSAIAIYFMATVYGWR